MTHHGPGWSVTLGPDHDYMLWAPQGEGGRRQYWRASWDRDRGHRGSFRTGTSPEEVLACFPTDEEGREARGMLLAAAGQAVGSPAG